MLSSFRRRSSRVREHRHHAHRHPPRLLRTPSFLVTSVAAIGGLSAIGAVPASEPAGDVGAVGDRIGAPEATAAEEPFTEAGETAATSAVSFDAIGAVRPVELASLERLGSEEELSLLALDDAVAERDTVAEYDVLDPAEFAGLATVDVVEEDGTDVAEDGTEPADDDSAAAGEGQPLLYEGADGETIDPERLRVWLEGRNYPLAEYAEELVAAGIEHHVDPRLIVGIAVIESSGGKRLPPSTHNAWGWSGNGPHGLQSWSSWPEAIDGFTEGLARVYDTDNVDERMARKYVPPNWEKWLRTVRWVMNDI